MSDMHGKFVWIELMTSDPEAAEGFYSKVVGWSAKDSGQPGMSYMLLSMGETMMGGLMAIPEEAKKMGARPIWLGYIAVDDVDTYAAKIKAAGGRVLKEPTDVPGMLRFAVVTDPYMTAFMIMKLDPWRTAGVAACRRRVRPVVSAGASCMPARSTARGRSIPGLFGLDEGRCDGYGPPTANISCSTSMACRAAA